MERGQESEGGMTIGTIDSKHPAEVLAQYRTVSHPVFIDQARKFKSLAPADQRELLFHMLMHQTVVVNKLQILIENEQIYRELCPSK